MSLHDIFMQRAMLEHANKTTGSGWGGALQNLVDGVSSAIDEARKLKAEEQQRTKGIENGLKLAEKLNTDGSRVVSVVSVNEKGGITTNFKGKSEEDPLERERARLARERLDLEIEKEKRLKGRARFSIAKSFGGTVTEEELGELSTDADLSIGTDLQSGRIESFADDKGVQKYRILSDQEFSKKSSIIKDVKDAESGMNIVRGDIEQISSMFDAIPKGLKGPIEGRVKAFPAKLAGNTEINVYDDMVNAFTSTIARSLLLEKGVLTDADVARAKQLLPKLSDSEETKTSKMSEINKMLNTRFNEFVNRTKNTIGDAGNNTPSNGGKFSGMFY